MENENKDVLPPVQILDLARRCGIKATEAALVEFAALVRAAEPLAPEEMRPAPVAQPVESATEVAPIAWMKPGEIAGLLKAAREDGEPRRYGRIYARQYDPSMVPVCAAPVVGGALVAKNDEQQNGHVVPPTRGTGSQHKAGASAWISVDERLPDDDCRVLAATWFTMTRDQHMDIVSFRSGSGQFSHSDVTHWMPLPLPPAQSQLAGSARQGGNTNNESVESLATHKPATQAEGKQ